MKDSVIPFTIIQGGGKNREIVPNTECISFIESLLERAKSGELQSIVMVGLCNNGAVGSGWAGDQFHAFAMVGALDTIKTEFSDFHIEKKRP